MSGFNLPPGCSVSDIPGNRPSDAAYEKLYEDVSEKLGGWTKDLDGGAEDDLTAEVVKMIEDAYQNGFRDGVNDEKMSAASGIDLLYFVQRGNA